MKPLRKKAVLHYKTLILSDIHLGTEDCQIDKVNDLLKHIHCDKLILNGDIIDGWALGRRGGWTRKHTRFIRLVLKRIEKKRTEVIYLRGNHDDVLDRFLPLHFDKLRIVDKYIHKTPRGRYLVVHGDVFDAVTQNSRLVAMAGDIGYKTLLKFNRLYNRYRRWRGKEPFSLSKHIKAKTKSVVNYISRFEQNVEQFTRREGCTGFICGHIHTPDDKFIGTVHYMNSGDWVESATAIVEHENGRLELINYDTFSARLAEEEARCIALEAESLFARVETPVAL
ncbi:MAG: UDP-2,3-diacylglucosamine diphosphatase [Opitutales bacterium]|nr:UDP-2,3-diacylglucosamine diphosphatase [Opitutales bacterium]